MSQCSCLTFILSIGAAKFRRLTSLDSVFLAFLLGLSMLIPLSTQALESDRDQQIEIEADSNEFRVKEGVVIYNGNVKMKQGSMLLTADNIRIIYNEDGQVNRLVAKGNRAYFEQLPAEDQQKVIAQGRTIEYILQDDVINLIEQASITQEGATLNGNRITYDVRNHLLKANSVSSNASSRGSSERVKVVIPSLGPTNRAESESAPQ